MIAFADGPQDRRLRELVKDWVRTLVRVCHSNCPEIAELSCGRNRACAHSSLVPGPSIWAVPLSFLMGADSLAQRCFSMGTVILEGHTCIARAQD